VDGRRKASIPAPVTAAASEQAVTSAVHMTAPDSTDGLSSNLVHCNLPVGEYISEYFQQFTAGLRIAKQLPREAPIPPEQSTAKSPQSGPRIRGT